MNTNKKKLLLTDIAKSDKATSVNEILAALIPFSLVYAHVENVTLTSSLLSKYFTITDLPIPEMYLFVVLSKETWVGDKIEIPSSNAATGDYEITIAEFKKDICISAKDLFVYESEFMALKDRLPDIFQQKQLMSTKEEDNLYALIGVFLDMLINKKDKNILPNALPAPEGTSEYIFQSQSDLIKYIERYDIHGLKESSLENKFSKANAALIKKT